LLQKSNTTSCDPLSLYTPIRLQTEGAQFVVHRQPIALDRLTVHDVRQDLTGASSKQQQHTFSTWMGRHRCQR